MKIGRDFISGFDRVLQWPEVLNNDLITQVTRRQVHWVNRPNCTLATVFDEHTQLKKLVQLYA